MSKFLDVSEWQGVIDWETVKPNVAGVILRAGWGNGNPDRQFHRNASECNRLGIPCGAYWFSYALTPQQARNEAKSLLAAVAPFTMELPLAFDYEYDSVKTAERNGITVDKKLATSLVYAFCKTIEQGGYWCLNYSNPDFLSRYFAEDVPQRFGLWLAQWPGGVPDLTKPPRSDAVLWQWTSKGRTPGINTDVDTNEAFVDFAKLIRDNGLNHLKETETPKQSAMEWAKARGYIPQDAQPTQPVTWYDVAQVIASIHGPII